MAARAETLDLPAGHVREEVGNSHDRDGHEGHGGEEGRAVELQVAVDGEGARALRVVALDDGGDEQGEREEYDED